jgi:2-C-methyl-D-erythritol 2,4-cyclodiphosphate synthase
VAIDQSVQHRIERLGHASYPWNDSIDRFNPSVRLRRVNPNPILHRRVAFPHFRISRYNPRRFLTRKELQTVSFRIGSGHDTHRLVEGRPLILGGVAIPHPRGLAGHSDADVVLHAVTDALLGAAALGDIGDTYPDTDPRWKGADSRLFLAETIAKLNQLGWRIVNLDVTIFAQEPKLGPVKAAIRQSLATLLAVAQDAVNVKAKTGEKVGHIGRSEAIGCHTVVLIERM